MTQEPLSTARVYHRLGEPNKRWREHEDVEVSINFKKKEKLIDIVFGITPKDGEPTEIWLEIGSDDFVTMVAQMFKAAGK